MGSSYKEVLFFLGLAIVGVVLYSARLNFRRAEDSAKENDWISVLLFGPSGYYRAVFGLMGILFTLIGVIGAIWHAFHLIAA